MNDKTILFRTHNDTSDQFLEYKKQHSAEYDDLLFIEGISGGNSTDLFIRRIPKDSLLYYKLLESCLTRVMIIDERLWGINAGCEMDQWPLLRIDDVPQIIQEINRYEKLPGPKWRIKLNTLLNLWPYKQIDEELFKYLYSIRNEADKITKELIDRKYINDTKIDKVVYRHELYKKKGIDIINLLFHFNFSTGDFFCLDPEKKVPVFSIKKVAASKSISIESNVDLNTYHIVCVHQGIIDKIRDKIGFRIDLIYQALTTAFNGAIKIIHSGRGKPQTGIPEGFFFLPYASLEGAMNDCKYSLTEVLFNVKEELK